MAKVDPTRALLPPSAGSNSQPEPHFGPFATVANARGWAAVRTAALALVCALPTVSPRLCAALGACCLHANVANSGEAEQCVVALAAICVRASVAESPDALVALVAAALSPRAFGTGSPASAFPGAADETSEATGAGVLAQLQKKAESAPDALQASAAALGRWAAPGPALHTMQVRIRCAVSIPITFDCTINRNITMCRNTHCRYVLFISLLLTTIVMLLLFLFL
ncbi:hypothetical protein T492DRAFT_172158 [Pavlovales sp. CCMP2436]|nr:hypothetical protein T492DRAFT_172158 [Pavlovales sp. CCMP2436]